MSAAAGRSNHTAPYPPIDDDQDDPPSPGTAGGRGAGNSNKRKRVVVACVVCQRKKTKCRIEPNETECENCKNYGYSCVFSTKSDRTRGKYELLESRAGSLLAALRSVAPHLADQYERGELSVAGPSGSGYHPEEQWRSMDPRLPSVVSPEGDAASSHASTSAAGPPRPVAHVPVPASSPFTGRDAMAAPEGPRLGPSSFEMASMLPPSAASSSARPSLPSIRSLGAPLGSSPTTRPRFGPMVPDLEDGRPRFFGRSSTLSHFHAMESRAPSLSPPPPGEHSSKFRADRTPSRSRATSRERDLYRNSAWEAAGSQRPTPKSELSRATSANDVSQSAQAGVPTSSLKAARDGRGENIKQDWKVLPRPQPSYPSNSREWVHLMRRKMTVAVGRDDICSDEWMTRYMLPPTDLILHLLDTIYFPLLHPLLPILHPPTFRRDVISGRGTHDTAFRGLVFCVITIASRFSTDPRVLADPDDPHSAGDHWAAGSRLYHQAFAASLINVQMLILTSTFMHANLGPGTTWMVLGVAIRALQDIGLHQERANADYTPFDREMRRRAFWATFVMDGIFAVCLGRPHGIRLEDSNVNLPLDVSDEALSRSEATGEPISADTSTDKQPTVVSGFRHLIKINLLIHDVVQNLYTSRKAGIMPEWQQHPAAGPTSSGSDEGEGPSDDKDSKDDDIIIKGDLSQAHLKEGKGKKLFNKDDIPAAKRKQYKAMAHLCKRLDDWVDQMPEHVKDPKNSPYKLQASLLACGRHDIRLYILKPFLPDTYLYKMLQPQCVTHARACLQHVVDLYDNETINTLIFIFTQAFMSSVTFMLTTWHVTTNAKDLLRDADLIEKTARMMRLRFDDRFCTAVARKVWRVLQRTAMRLLPHLPEEQKKRMERWISLKGSAGGLPLPPRGVSSIKSGSEGPMPSSSNGNAGVTPVAAPHHGSPGGHGIPFQRTASGNFNTSDVRSSAPAGDSGAAGSTSFGPNLERRGSGNLGGSAGIAAPYHGFNGGSSQPNAYGNAPGAPSRFYGAGGNNTNMYASWPSGPGTPGSRLPGSASRGTPSRAASRSNSRAGSPMAFVSEYWQSHPYSQSQRGGPANAPSPASLQRSHGGIAGSQGMAAGAFDHALWPNTVHSSPQAAQHGGGYNPSPSLSARNSYSYGHAQHQHQQHQQQHHQHHHDHLNAHGQPFSNGMNLDLCNFGDVNGILGQTMFMPTNAAGDFLQYGPMHHHHGQPRQGPEPAAGPGGNGSGFVRMDSDRDMNENGDPFTSSGLPHGNGPSGMQHPLHLNGLHRHSSSMPSLAGSGTGSGGDADAELLSMLEAADASGMAGLGGITGLGGLMGMGMGMGIGESWGGGGGGGGGGGNGSGGHFGFDTADVGNGNGNGGAESGDFPTSGSSEGSGHATQAGGYNIPPRSVHSSSHLHHLSHSGPMGLSPSTASSSAAGGLDEDGNASWQDGFMRFLSEFGSSTNPGSGPGTAPGTTAGPQSGGTRTDDDVNISGPPPRSSSSNAHARDHHQGQGQGQGRKVGGQPSVLNPGAGPTAIGTVPPNNRPIHRPVKGRNDGSGGGAGGGGGGSNGDVKIKLGH